MIQYGISFILSAPSGTGKTTICKILREQCADLKFSVSHTTRAPRPNETNGVDYHFISETEFSKKVKNREFLEFAKIHNNYYGTALETLESVKSEGNDILCELDVQGAKILRKLNFDGVFIFLLPPSLEEMRKRLTKRGTESQEKIEARLSTGEKEITQYKLYDYVIVNHSVEDTVQTLKSIFISERNRTRRFIPPSEDIQQLIQSKAKVYDPS